MLQCDSNELSSTHLNLRNELLNIMKVIGYEPIKFEWDIWMRMNEMTRWHIGCRLVLITGHFDDGVPDSFSISIWWQQCPINNSRICFLPLTGPATSTTQVNVATSNSTLLMQKTREIGNVINVIDLETPRNHPSYELKWLGVKIAAQSSGLFSNLRFLFIAFILTISLRILRIYRVILHNLFDSHFTAWYYSCLNPLETIDIIVRIR